MIRPELLRALFAAHPSRMPFIVDPDVPLFTRYAPTGCPIAVACVRIGDALHFHPDRLAELRAALSRPLPTSRELARWADDGGAS